MIGFTIPSREPIPPITHPLGRGWRQPDLARIVFERGVAFMDARTFAELGEYSTSLPTFAALLERLALRTILTCVDGFGPHRRGVALASLELNPPMFIHKALLGREREGGAEYFALHTDQTWGIMVIESEGP